MRQVGNYTAEDIPIGSGGMGQVLRGYTPDGSRPVAIKEILPQYVSDPEYRIRIEKEIDFLKALDNEHVVKVYDHFELDGKLYIVMELVEGLNIEEYVSQHGPIKWEDAARYMVELLNTMQYVHEHGIVHRDIKPGNIMIRHDGGICLLDFGVAKDLNTRGRSGETECGTIIGTDGYMSPEQAQGMSIDHRSDIYALGCVMFFMLTGTHAYAHFASEFEMQYAIVERPYPRLGERIGGIPDSVQKVLDQATAKNMMKRYQSCREFANGLRQLTGGGTEIKPAVNEDAIQITVGREGCDILVGLSNMQVSRHHADIRLKRFTGGEYYVYTDCSSNGTLIDGRKLTRGMSYNIARGANAEIYLAGDPNSRVDMQEVDRLIGQRLRRSGSEGWKQSESRNNGNSGSELRGHGSSGSHQGSYGNVEALPPNYRRPGGAMSFGAAIKSCFNNYANFRGRASRAEYWYFALFCALVMLLPIILTVVSIVNYSEGLLIFSFVLMIGILLIMLLPSMSVTARRLHDVGRSYWWTLLSLTGIGSIVIFVWTLTAGEPGSNKYGATTGSTQIMNIEG